MKLWRYLSDSKERDRLHFFSFVESDDSRELMAAATTVFTALWPVVRPLSLTLQMAAWPHDSICIDSKIPVPISYWHLYEMSPPAHVAIPGWIDPSKDSEEAIPELTLQALADWLARAHAQQLPEGYFSVLETLRMHASRACLLEDQEPYAELTKHQNTSVIPVEKREDGFWVSGPVREGMVIHPPIEIELFYDYGRLDLEISVYWSPWIEAGFAEAELLKSCLQELEKDGWVAD